MQNIINEEELLARIQKRREVHGAISSNDIKFLTEIDYPFSEDEARKAALESKLDVLYFLYNKGINFDKYVIIAALQKGDNTLTEWLFKVTPEIIWEEILGFY